jgi:hypothetical protein
MSKVYHGSLEEVRIPEIREPNRSLDYGSGFYTTTSFDQAKRLVERRIKDRAIKDNTTAIGFVNSYELDDNAVKNMKTLVFKKPNEDWVNFVMKNRTERGYIHDYDIVYGPVADDSVYTQFTLFEGGIISMATLIHELKTYKLVDQYLFHTAKSLNAIRFVESIKIEI